MVKSLENGVSLPPFLLKCYEMVDDQSTDALISWSSTNDNSFVIWDSVKFSSELLPKYFKHSNFSSFIRQLNIYGFRKTDTDHWEFANDLFIKGQKHLLKSISRRKQPQGVAQRKLSPQKDDDVGPCEENRILGLRKEVECLTTDRNVLMQELVKLRQHQQTSQSKLLLVSEQLNGMEKSQQQMLSFIVMVMQNPGFLVQLLKPKENIWRKTEAGKNVSDGMIVRYQLPANESSEPKHPPTPSPEESPELNLSSDELKDLFMDIDFMPGPLDEKLISLVNHGPLILPDAFDGDSMLEQLLSDCPSLENNENADLDPEDPKDTGNEIQPTSGGSAKGVEKSQKLSLETAVLEAQLDIPQNMEMLAEQMGHLAAVNSLKD